MWRKIWRGLIALVVIMAITIVLMVASLRWIDPPTSAFILRHNLEAFLSGDVDRAKYTWTEWSAISPNYAIAVIAAEDQRFPDHIGIDFTELKNAVSEDDGSPRGASTITQQTAKNLFLWSGRSYVRKLLEAGFAILLEITLSKQRILEIYLNLAQTGPGLYGITAASRHYYGKRASELNRHEAARIAAILPNPSRYSVISPSAYMLKRQQWILKQMNQLGGPSYLDRL